MVVERGTSSLLRAVCQSAWFNEQRWAYRVISGRSISMTEPFGIQSAVQVHVGKGKGSFDGTQVQRLARSGVAEHLRHVPGYRDNLDAAPAQPLLQLGPGETAGSCE
jgi:hypothetical protein